MRITALICGLLLLFALPLLAEEPSVMNPEGTARCEPTGTWFGGSQPFNPYMMTISAGNGGRYTVDWQLVVPAIPFEGYLGISHWSGELVRVSPGKYEAWAILYAVYDPVWAEANGIDPSLPEGATYTQPHPLFGTPSQSSSMELPQFSAEPASGMHAFGLPLLHALTVC